MTEPMTPARLEEIRAAHARDRYEPFSDDVRVLLAEVERLRALPVLRTCGECRWCGHGAVCDHDGAQGPPVRLSLHVDRRAAPPSWCPLRGGAR